MSYIWLSYRIEVLCFDRLDVGKRGPFLNYGTYMRGILNAL